MFAVVTDMKVFNVVKAETASHRRYLWLFAHISIEMKFSNNFVVSIILWSRGTDFGKDIMSVLLLLLLFGQGVLISPMILCG